MNCETCQRDLSAWLDDELPDDQRQRVGGHLLQCVTCQQVLEELRQVDTRLRLLEIPSSARQQTMAAVKSVPAQPAESQVRIHRWRVVPWVIASLAASIMIAIVAIQPRGTDPIVVDPASPETTTVARLVRSTGELETFDPGTERWQRVTADHIGAFPAGARVRTLPGVVCEIETVNQSKLRLDASTEVVLHSAGHVQIVDGQIWSRIGANDTMRVDTPAPNVSTPQSDSLLTMQCPSDSEFQWSVDVDASVFQSLTETESQLTMNTFSCPVGGGEKVSIRPDLQIEREPTQPQSAKVWQIPLLALDQSDAELGGMLESMLVQIGSTKAGFMQEQQVRQLGPRGAIPLLAYVQSKRSEQNPSARHHAMRIAAETADASAMDRLRTLQNDADPEIAQLATQAIARIGRS